MMVLLMYCGVCVCIHLFVREGGSVCVREIDGGREGLALLLLLLLLLLLPHVDVVVAAATTSALCAFV